MNIEQLLSLDEFEKIEQWLEQNLVIGYGPVEQVRFGRMQWMDDLDDGVMNHAKGYDCRGPYRHDGLLADGPYAGFYGDLEFNVFSRKDDVYISPYEIDLLDGLPIFAINRSPLSGNGREKVQYIAEALVSETPPRRIILEQTQRFRCKVFMFAIDFTDLSDSVRVRSLLTAA